MPADLSLGHGIVQAYLQGLQARREQEQLAFQKEHQTAQLGQQKEEFEKQLAQTKEFHESQLDLQRAQLKHALIGIKAGIAEKIGTGFIPPNMVPYSGYDPITGVGKTFDIGEGLPSLEAISAGAKMPEITTKGPVSFGGVNLQPGEYFTAKELGKTQVEAKGPLAEIKLQQSLVPIQLKAALQGLNQLAVEHAKSLTAGSLEAQREKGRTELAKFNQAEAYKRAIDVANIKARAAREGKLDKPLSVIDAERLGVPLGKTYRDVTGMVPVKQFDTGTQKKLDDLNSFKEEILKTIDLGVKTSYSAHKPVLGNVIAAYKSQYPGKDPQELLDYKATLGSLTAEQIHEKYGSAFSANEAKYAGKFIPSLSSDPKDARTKLNILLEQTNSKINSILKPSAIKRTLPAAPAKTGTSWIINPSTGKLEPIEVSK